MINRLVLIFISFLFLAFSVFVSGYFFITSLGLSFALFVFLSFINKLGNELPIKEFILTLASFQWIVGAKISYNLGKQHYKYYMYVGEEEYMGYVVPAVLLFYIGISFFPVKLDLDELKELIQRNSEKLKGGAIALIVVGVASSVLGRIYQGGLSFVFYLAELLLYVGISYLLFIYERQKYWLLFFTLGLIFVLSILGGSFHKLLLVGSFLSFFALTSRFKFSHKLLIIMFGAAFVFVIQSVKQDYRDIVWGTRTNEGRVSVFFDLVTKELVGAPSDDYYATTEEEGIKEQAEINVRLNQGWIISKTLENVPKNTPFQNGTTIRESIKASILPRFLFPEKMGAAQGLENFRKISGLDLNGSTSMELSIIAEFYANYGHFGGQLSMFLYGLFLASLIRFIGGQLGNGSILIFLWIALFFMQPVKAEIDLIKIVNHLVKSIVFFLFVKYVMIKIGGYQLFIKEEHE
jgi:hypothetical protein